MAAFEVYDNDGFRVTFPNGYAVSVAFGRINYCDRGATTAETAIYDPDENFVPYAVGRDAEPDDGNVQGWMTPMDVLAVMQWASQQVTQ